MAERKHTKFFTNEEGNSLYERFNRILKNAQYFDSLVGYFRSSGFYRLCDSLENIEKIRILIGLNVDKQTYDAIQEVEQKKLDFEAQANIRKQFKEEVKIEFENSQDTSDVVKGVNKFKELLASGKLEMKACREQNIHAKVYITRYDEEKYGWYGSVVTGSSNFTENGLNAQYEFNVELKDDEDVDFALEKFEALWKNAVPISEDYINALETGTWLNDNITPYEIYLKFLYEYFYDEINTEQIFDANDLPDNYMKLDYQINAIAKINKIVEEYGGVFISDVVGLGKTYIAAMYAKILTGKILVIAPPPIIPNWRGAFKDFDIKSKNYDIESIGMLHKILERIKKDEKIGKKTYDYVFIDEAHRFRNGKNEQYAKLKEICTNKKVILISATPLNNTFYDFFYLISLFQNPLDSQIPGLPDLDSFFANRRQKIKMIEKECGTKDDERYINAVKQVSKEVRDKILKYLMIRRTRTDIKNHFKDDIKKQGLFFPEVQAPKEIVYEFDKHTNDIFNKTISIIGTEESKQAGECLTYARYQPKTYFKKHFKQLTPFEETQQKNNVGFMKSRLIKRLESSKYAFEMTLERSIKSHEKMLSMIDKGTIFISKEINVLDYIDDDTKTIEDLLEKGETKELEAFPVNAFNDDFVSDLKKDLAYLKELLNDWRNIKHDYKQEKFIYELATNPLLKDEKLVIFTESAETGENLSNVLKEIYGDKVLFYSSSQNENIKEIIKNNYDPNQEKGYQEDDIKLLITTDVLSEGINLHRSNIIVDYDLPWNPTRIMQRVGRVNRVGTKHDKVYIFNFFPTSETDKELGLKESIIAKIQAFHNALGNDSKYLSDTEEVESYNLRGEQLYKNLNSTDNIEDKEENPELKYLDLIRKVRDKNTDLFVKIKDLPKKIRVARDYKDIDANSLVTFFRKGKNLLKFCITDGTTSKEIQFEDAVKFFECEENEKKKNIPEVYFDYIEKNKSVFGQPIVTESLMTVKKGRSKTDKIIKILKTLDCSKYTQDEKAYIQAVINAFNSRNIAEAVAKKLSDFLDKEFDDLKILAGIHSIVPDIYLHQNINSKNSNANQKREIVLSEFLYARGE